MKTMKLKGKDYVQVVERLKYFNENFKPFDIRTTYEVISDKVIFKASVYNANGDVEATGHAMKTIDQEFNFEKCETRAIGRCLGIFGIGSDNSISTYDEAREAIGAETDQRQALIEKAKSCFNEVEEKNEEMTKWFLSLDKLSSEDIVKGLNKIQTIIVNQRRNKK
jgi:hypothetical protein